MSASLTEKILSRDPLSTIKTFSISVLLVDDQQIVAEAVGEMLANQEDIVLHYCSDPSLAIQMANQVMPTVILQDLVMPDIDGLMLVRYFRANPLTHDVPLIVLSSQEEPKIKAEAFALGANDYVVKLPDKEELVARIRYHSSAYIRLLERNQAYLRLEESQRVLQAELAEAASYVQSLLPPPLENGVSTAWRFITSTQLGGDAFGYYWMDKENLVFYLLDVCGHGIGAALLSISVMNVLRSQNLPNTNFFDPSEVLRSLNNSFQMENHNNMFFTIWYGVYNSTSQKLTYASAGHPPAILIKPDKMDAFRMIELKTPGTAIGVIQEATFQNAVCVVDKDSILYLFSDGVYEITSSEGNILSFSDFIEILREPTKDSHEDLDRIVNYSKSLNGSETFADDFSLLRISFKSDLL